jgi:hypothetical protein
VDAFQKQIAERQNADLKKGGTERIADDPGALQMAQDLAKEKGISAD